MDKIALIYVQFPDSSPEIEQKELEELIRTAQGEIALSFSQKRNSIDPVSVIGFGKLEEIKAALEINEDIGVAIFSCNLSSTQRTYLKKTLNVDILDKIDLILDIFALRASSAEGKKQVELAQLTYNLATRPEGDFSRQGAGIGTRGPGETKLEMNKRLARKRIHFLKQELERIEKQRQLTRKKRTANDMFTIALVGYTNAGKSTLFNRITSGNVYADNLLFATLDATIRKCVLDCGIEVLFIDTVGFIRDLPHTLVNAFKSTLEEATNADLLLNVCDISDEHVEEHIAVTEQLLAELNASAPLIRVYNKCDVSDISVSNSCDNKVLFVSAKTGQNVDVLLDTISQFVLQKYAKITLKAPLFESGILLGKLHNYTNKYDIEYFDDYVLVHTTVRKEYVTQFTKYLHFC